MSKFSDRLGERLADMVMDNIAAWAAGWIAITLAVRRWTPFDNHAHIIGFITATWAALIWRYEWARWATITMFRVLKALVTRARVRDAIRPRKHRGTIKELSELDDTDHGRRRALHLVREWTAAAVMAKYPMYDDRRVAGMLPLRCVRLEHQGVTTTVVLKWRKGIAPVVALRDLLPGIASAAGAAHDALFVDPGKDAATVALRLRTGEPFGGKPPVPVVGHGADVLDGVDIGVDDAGNIVHVPLVHHALVAGMTGAGKSNTLRIIMQQVIACENAALAVVDVQGAYAGWQEVAHAGYARTLGEVAGLVASLNAEAERRYQILAATRTDEIEPTPATPAIVVILDEAGMVLRTQEGKQLRDLLVSAAEGWRKVRIVLWVATQHPTDAEIPRNMTVNLPTRIALRVADPTASRLLLDQWTQRGYDASTLPGNGRAFVLTPEFQRPVLTQCFEAPKNPVGAGVPKMPVPRVAQPVAGPQVSRVGRLGSGKSKVELIAPRVRELALAEPGLSQVELARRLGVPRATLQRAAEVAGVGQVAGRWVDLTAQQGAASMSSHGCVVDHDLADPASGR